MLHIHVIPRQKMVKSHLHDPLDAEPVNVPHGEVLDPQVLQDVAGMVKKHSEYSFCSKGLKIKGAIFCKIPFTKVFYQ